MEQVETTKSKNLSEIPDASGWSEAMDALLLQRRGEKRLPWKAVAPIGGMNEKRCQQRYKLLTSGGGRPQARPASEEPVVVDRDGLDWLQRKGRLTPARHAAALHYRKVFRDAGEVSMRSCLDVSIGGGADGFGVQAIMAGAAAARRELQEIRARVLGSQSDMLTVVDGVCGIGHTLRGLVGVGSAEWVKDRAKVLEAVLMVALDLVDAHLGGGRSLAA